MLINGTGSVATLVSVVVVVVAGASLRRVAVRFVDVNNHIDAVVARAIIGRERVVV